MNASCIICSDMLTPKSEIYTTACGHLFHYHCLTQWIERSKTCPQCRHKETGSSIHRIYLNFASSECIADDACTLQSKIDTVNFEISLKDKDIAKYSKKYKECKTKCTSMRETIVDMELKARQHEAAMLAMKYQLANYQEKMRDKDKHMAEITRLKKQLEGMDHMKTVINNCQSQVEKMMRNNSDPDSLAVLIVSLKTQLEEIKKQNQSCSSQLNAIGREMIHNNTTISKIKHRNEHMQNDLVAHEQCSSEMKYLRQKINETKSLLPTQSATVTTVSSPALGNSTIISESGSIIILDSTTPITSSHNETSYTPQLPSNLCTTQSTDVLDITTPTRPASVSRFQSLTRRLKPVTVPLPNSNSASSSTSQETHRSEESTQKQSNNSVKRMKSATSFTSANKYRKLGPGNSRRPS